MILIIIYRLPLIRCPVRRKSSSTTTSVQIEELIRVCHCSSEASSKTSSSSAKRRRKWSWVDILSILWGTDLLIWKNRSIFGRTRGHWLYWNSFLTCRKIGGTFGAATILTSISLGIVHTHKKKARLNC